MPATFGIRYRFTVACVKANALFRCVDSGPWATCAGLPHDEQTAKRCCFGHAASAAAFFFLRQLCSFQIQTATGERHDPVAVRRRPLQVLRNCHREGWQLRITGGPQALPVRNEKCANTVPVGRSAMRHSAFKKHFASLRATTSIGAAVPVMVTNCLIYSVCWCTRLHMFAFGDQADIQFVGAQMSRSGCPKL